MYIFLFENLQWKRSLERPKRRWEDNMEVDTKEIGSEVVDEFKWIRTNG
jgi:hypothetical protein